MPSPPALPFPKIKTSMDHTEYGAFFQYHYFKSTSIFTWLFKENTKQYINDFKLITMNCTQFLILAFRYFNNNLYKGLIFVLENLK